MSNHRALQPHIISSEYRLRSRRVHRRQDAHLTVSSRPHRPDCTPEAPAPFLVRPPRGCVLPPVPEPSTISDTPWLPFGHSTPCWKAFFVMS